MIVDTQGRGDPPHLLSKLVFNMTMGKPVTRFQLFSFVIIRTERSTLRSARAAKSSSAVIPMSDLTLLSSRTEKSSPSGILLGDVRAMSYIGLIPTERPMFRSARAGRPFRGLSAGHRMSQSSRTVKSSLSETAMLLPLTIMISRLSV